MAGQELRLSYFIHLCLVNDYCKRVPTIHTVDGLRRHMAEKMLGSMLTFHHLLTNSFLYVI